MQRVDLKKVHWPELTLVVFGLLFVLVLMIRTSSASCHHWKQEMVHLSGAFLAAAGEEEYPLPETGISDGAAESPQRGARGYSTSDPPVVSEPLARE